MKGHIRKRGEKSWAVILDIGRDANGKRRQKWHRVRGTKKDAQRELNRLLYELDEGTYIEPAKLSVGDYLERWLDDYAANNVAGKTLERYTEIVRDHIKPAIGHVMLPKLQPLQIQNYYSKALVEGRKDGKGGLSAQTVLHHHRVLRGALKQAMRWQMLARNPADAVEPPRPERQQMKALDEAGTVELLEAAKRSRLYRPIFLAVTTGMRRGEILALRWSAIDLDKGVLSVRESLEQTRKGLNFKQPKTGRSSRTIDLPQLIIAELRAHRAEQAQNRLALGPGYQDNDLVFPEPDGQPWAPDKLSSAFAALVRRAKLTGFRFHDLRHTHATQLLKQSVHPKIVSERLGHATVAITLDTYSHVMPGMQQDAVQKIDDTLRIALQHSERSKSESQ